MTPNKGNLLSKSTYSGTECARVGNGTLLPIIRVGSIMLPTSTRPLSLHRVLHVPDLKHDLISSSQL